MSRRVMVLLGLTGAVVMAAAVFVALLTVQRGGTLAGAAPGSGENVRISEAGGVSVQVELRPASGRQLEFVISMDTHSVDLLQFDLTRLSRVIPAGGPALTEADWVPRGGGGAHHVAGTLRVQDPNGLAAKAPRILLEISGLPGEEVRRFEWQGTGQ